MNEQEKKNLEFYKNAPDAEKLVALRHEMLRHISMIQGRTKILLLSKTFEADEPSDEPNAKQAAFLEDSLNLFANAAEDMHQLLDILVPVK